MAQKSRILDFQKLSDLNFFMFSAVPNEQQYQAVFSQLET